jgi:hypothetical protein
MSWVKLATLIQSVDQWELEVVLNSNLFIQLVQGQVIYHKLGNPLQAIQTRLWVKTKILKHRQMERHPQLKKEDHKTKKRRNRAQCQILNNRV